MPRRLNRLKIAAIERHVASGLEDAEIGRIVGVSPSAVRAIRDGEHRREPVKRKAKKAKRVRRPRSVVPRPHLASYVPTEDEIAQRCYELRMQRDDPEPERWSPPVIDMTAFTAAAN